MRVTPAFNLNYVNLRERNVVNVTPEDGTTRRRQHLALQEAFGEVKLVRRRRQLRFRFGARAASSRSTATSAAFCSATPTSACGSSATWGQNRNQWNVAYFDQLEKETNSELNLLERRNQRVFIANYYRQDFLTLGYTISPSVHANLDDGEEFFFDANGFLVRPSPIGLIRPHKVHAYYAGLGGDGHWGRLNVTHQFYQAFGDDDFNGVSGQPLDINAQFAAVEFSIDKDWYRPRIGFVYASGDADPDDDTAKGFDAITTTRTSPAARSVSGTGRASGCRRPAVGLVGRTSVLPALRSSKTEGQASFVNPGVLDAQCRCRRRADDQAEADHSTSTCYASIAPKRCSGCCSRATIDKAIGLDYGGGLAVSPCAQRQRDDHGRRLGASCRARGFKQIFDRQGACIRRSLS